MKRWVRCSPGGRKRDVSAQLSVARRLIAPSAWLSSVPRRWRLRRAWLLALALGWTRAPLAAALSSLQQTGDSPVPSSAVPAKTDASSRAAEIAAGNQLLADHHDPEAMDHFETVLAVEPQDAAARAGELRSATELALNARQAGHPEVAIEVLRHATSALPDEPQLQLELGIQATELHLLPEATTALSAALALRAHDSATLYALARVETEEQQLPAAEQHLRAVLAAEPDDASAHFGLGRLLAMEQRTEEARSEFNTSIRLQPTQTESFYQLGQLALEAHDDTTAGPLFQRVLLRAPTHAGALTGMGELALRTKDYTAAEHLLAQAEAADPDYAAPHYYRGLALAHLGRKAEADAELHSNVGHTVASAPPPATADESPERP